MLMDDEFGVIDPEEGEVLDLVRGEEGSEYKIMGILRFCFFCFHFDTNDEDINVSFDYDKFIPLFCYHSLIQNQQLSFNQSILLLK